MYIQSYTSISKSSWNSNWNPVFTTKITIYLCPSIAIECSARRLTSSKTELEGVMKLGLWNHFSMAIVTHWLTASPTFHPTIKIGQLQSEKHNINSLIRLGWDYASILTVLVKRSSKALCGLAWSFLRCGIIGQNKFPYTNWRWYEAF